MIVPHTTFHIAGEKANPKQVEFLCKSLRPNDFRYFAFGGAIRGGKSFVVLFILHQLCLKFKSSKWLVVRESLPALKKTTIPSFKKLIDCSYYGKWNYSAPITFKYHNGSELIFVPESLNQDKDLTAFLGLECNGIFLEQLEELSEKMWQMAMQRSGSLYIDPMPPAYIFTTFNPNQKFSKSLFYLPYIKGELKSPYLYMPALPKDNPFVTNDQNNAWDSMDERYKRQFIEGDWSNFDNDGSRWAYAYDPQKHLCEFELDNSKETILSFDFNRNPMTCSVVQTDHISSLDIYETIKLPNSDIYQMCEYIRTLYGNRLLVVTGDASGNSGSAMVQDNLNYYKIIANELNLNIRHFQVPTINPSIAKNRVLVNSLLSRGDVRLNKEKTKPLQFDLENVSVLADGTLKKQDRTDPAQQADALDTFRYACNVFLNKFVDM